MWTWSLDWPLPVNFQPTFYKRYLFPHTSLQKLSSFNYSKDNRSQIADLLTLSNFLQSSITSCLYVQIFYSAFHSQTPPICSSPSMYVIRAVIFKKKRLWSRDAYESCRPSADVPEPQRSCSGHSSALPVTNMTSSCPGTGTVPINRGPLEVYYRWPDSSNNYSNEQHAF